MGNRSLHCDRAGPCYQAAEWFVRLTPSVNTTLSARCASDFTAWGVNHIGHPASWSDRRLLHAWWPQRFKGGDPTRPPTPAFKRRVSVEIFSSLWAASHAITVQVNPR